MINHPDKTMRTAPGLQKKPASVVKKKPICIRRKKCTSVVRQTRIPVDPISYQIHRYNVNTKAIKDAYDVVNFERVLCYFSVI